MAKMQLLIFISGGVFSVYALRLLHTNARGTATSTSTASEDTDDAVAANVAIVRGQTPATSQGRNLAKAALEHVSQREERC